jgi:hypothetical protein
MLTMMVLGVFALVPQGSMKPARLTLTPAKVAGECGRGKKAGESVLVAQWCPSSAIAWAAYYIKSDKCLASGNEKTCE